MSALDDLLRKSGGEDRVAGSRVSRASDLDRLLSATDELPDSAENAVKRVAPVPSIDMPEELFPMGTSLDLNERQIEAVFSNSKANARDMERLNRDGLGEEFAEFGVKAARVGFENVVEPTFDVMTATNRGTATYAMEMLNGKTSEEALQQAAINLGDSMPGVDLERATDIHSFVDVAVEINRRAGGRGVGLSLQGSRDYFRGIIDLPTDEQIGLYSMIGAGFLLDVFLDPITYTPAGVIPATYVKARRALRAASVASGFSETGPAKLLDESIDFFATKFRPGHLMKKQDVKIQSGEQVLEELAGGGKESLEAMENARLIAENMFHNRMASGAQVAKRLFAHATEEELALMTLSLSHKPDIIRPMVEAAAREGRVDPKRVDDVLKGTEELRKELTYFFREQRAESIGGPPIVGLLNEQMLIDNHTYLVQPARKFGRRMMDRFFDKRGITRQIAEDPNIFPEIVGKASRRPRQTVIPEQFNTPEARMMAGYPVELNASAMFGIRNVQHAKNISTKYLMDTVLNDPRVAKRVLTELDGAAKESFRQKGYDFFDFKTKNADGSVDKATYLMPQAITKTLEDTRELYLNPEKLNALMSGTAWFTNGWKGWAVFSTGFHARNNWTEMSTSFLSGVGRPISKGGGYTDNLPAWFIRATRQMTGTDDLQMPGMLGIYSASARLAAGGSLELFGEGFVKRWAQGLGVKNPDQLKELSKLPQILDDAGKVMTDEEFVDEAASVGIFFKGWLGSEVSLADQARYFKALQKHAHAERKIHTKLTAKSETDKVFEYSYTGEPIGSVRIVDGHIIDVKFADDTPTGFFQNRDMIIDATKKGGRTISEDTAGMTGRQLEELGFVRFTEPNMRLTPTPETRALYTLPKNPNGDLIELSRDVLGDIEGPGVIEQMAHWVGPGSPITTANRTIGGLIENTHRMAHYLDRRLRGLDKFEAARDVKLWRFDYGELTPFERKYMTQLFPFYTWWRKNTVLQVWAMMNNPGRYARIPKVMNGLEALSADWKDIPTPDYYDQLSATRLPLALDDKAGFVMQQFGYQDLNAFNHQDIASRINPALKIGSEMLFGPSGGYDIFLDAPRERFRGEEGITGLGSKKESLARNIIPPFDKAARFAEAFGKGGGSLTSPEMIARMSSEFLGIGLKFDDVPRVLRANNIRTSKAIHDFKRKIRQREERKEATRLERATGQKPGASSRREAELERAKKEKAARKKAKSNGRSSK